MIHLAFFFREVVTPYGSTGHRGLTRWASIADCDDDRSSRYDTYLCGVLQSDFQSVDNCEAALRQACRIEVGEIAEWLHSGNQWVTTLRREGVQIDHQTVSEWDGQLDGNFTLAEFKAALEGWKRFLQMPTHLDSRSVIALPGGDAAP
jgi:hypothetical protein